MIFFKMICFTLSLCVVSSSLLWAADDLIDLGGVKFKAPFLKDPKKECKMESERMSCYFKDTNTMFVVTIGPKETEDDFFVYAKAFKSKKINLPLVSKPMTHELFWQEKRQWIHSMHSNAELPDHFTSYYLTVVKQKVLLFSVTSKDNAYISEFRKSSFKGLNVL